ncbi:MAG: DUF3078 domain-containing protein [Bacteroidota bacterium]
MTRLLFTLLSLMAVCNLFAQTDTADYQKFDPFSAGEYIHQLNEDASFWRNEDDSLRSDLIRLLNQANEPYDSISKRLSVLDLSGVEIVNQDLLLRDSTEIRWLNDSTFIIDSVGWNSDLILKRELDSLMNEGGRTDSSLFIPDTIVTFVIDTLALESLDLPMYRYSSGQITPSLDSREIRRSAALSEDSGNVVYTDSISISVARENSPFYKVDGKAQLDSLQLAVEALLKYNELKDSTRMIFTDMYGRETPLWITSGSHEIYRFWVKNFKDDSITLWMGNPSANEVSILLEDAIDVVRLSPVQLAPLPLTLKEPERKLAEMEMIESDPIFWEYGFSSALIFNQTYLSHWAKGGGNSLSTMLDVNGNATYHNKNTRTAWINSARLKYGNVIAEKNGLRKNNDIFEISSKLNKNKWSKVDLSASFYMLNQIARGYNYPNDSVIVSRFLNPASLTVGLGIDYKPFKHTSINLAPLSYKNTFVLDTAQIDQTNHGIAADKRVKQELGTQLVVMNKFSPMDDLSISNKVRLFSNYLNKPQNIDVDWELLLDKKISWFFTVRLNLHLIYDDDVRFTVFDEDNQAVILPDGSEKKVARAQFKEFIGLSLLFKL